MNLIKHTKIYLIISLIILIPGILSLSFWGLNFSIDFVGGTVLEYRLLDSTNQNQVVDDLKKVFEDQGVSIESVSVDQGSVLLRTKALAVDKNEPIKSQVEATLPLKQVSFETVGPAVGAETAKKSFTALLVASVFILLYIAFAFRNIPAPYSSFKFGSTALIAMLHDAFVVLGTFSILGHFLNVEVDALLITAILTVIGFSVHDTIVVFDRVRENLKKLPNSWGFAEIVNYSLVETLNRSVATSLTVVITLFALFLLGGESIRYFVLALLVGVVSGTYSSIFNAAPILVLWENYAKKHSKK